MADEQKSGMRRIYRKSWPYDNLFGSAKFELGVAQWGVWNYLLDFAKLSRVEPGLIAPNKEKAYTHEWLAAFLNIDLELFNETISVLAKTGRIEENGSGIRIINWYKYQTEYDRQKYSRVSRKSRKQAKELWACTCGFRMPIVKLTEKWEYCPNCLKRKNKKIRLKRVLNPDYEDE